MIYVTVYDIKKDREFTCLYESPYLAKKWIERVKHGKALRFVKVTADTQEQLKAVRGF